MRAPPLFLPRPARGLGDPRSEGTSSLLPSCLTLGDTALY
jgi:hypothetical protein